MVGLLDLMYQSLPLECGKKLIISAFNPDDFQKTELTIVVRAEVEEIQIGEESYIAFVCDVSPLDEVHYVIEDGRLLKVERPSQNVTIELGESTLLEPEIKVID